MTGACGIIREGHKVSRLCGGTTSSHGNRLSSRVTPYAFKSGAARKVQQRVIYTQ